ncbi:MAG: hypothetical protein ACYS47_17410, partial [Planctomycetota bacterium]
VPFSEEPPAPPDLKGYLSEEDRKRFNLKAGILAALAFLAQFFVPMVAMIPFMIYSFSSQRDFLWEGMPGRGALNEGSIWFPEMYSAGQQRGRGKNAILKKLELGGDEGPEKAQDLEVPDPWLLADDDRVWIVSSASMAFLRDDWVTPFDIGSPRGPITRPFLHQGLPAVIEEARNETRVIVFEDGSWREDFPIDLGETLPQGLQVLSTSPSLHLFHSDGRTLYTVEVDSDVPSDSDAWQSVGPAGTKWCTVLLEGEPAVFRITGSGFKSLVQGLRRGPQGWEIFFESPVPVATEFGVYAPPGEDRFFVLIQSMPGSFRLWTVEGDRVVEQKRFSRGFPFPRGVFLAMMIPQAFVFFLPVVLALI